MLECVGSELAVVAAVGADMLDPRGGAIGALVDGVDEKRAVMHS